ncbi:MAG: TOBE-like domain-containing protein [Polyangiaceae bacterium]|jgi:sulfate transport system ATP-binding protein
MTFEARGIHKHFGTYRALAGVSLRVEEGELVALLGPSGCGKTTFLRILAGLETLDAGEVLFDGVDVTRTPSALRGVGLVFQHYALFEHMTVFENVAFGLRVRRQPKPQIRERVSELLDRVRLQGYADCAPSQLSGGQRQRVALARALAAQPRILLLDEPFGALDIQVKQQLRTWLRKLHVDTHITTVLVTHDRDDAFELADRVAVMNQGHVEQVGSPCDVFRRPSNPRIMTLLGNVNEVPLERDGAQSIGYMRPHEVEVSRAARDAVSLSARVLRVQPAGASVRVELELDSGSMLIADIDERSFDELGLRDGEAVYVSTKRLHFFEAAP